MRQQKYEEALRAILSETDPAMIVSLGLPHSHLIRPLNEAEQLSTMKAVVRLVHGIAKTALEEPPVR